MKTILIGIDVSKEKLDATMVSYDPQTDTEKNLGHTVVENCPKGFRSLISWSKKTAGEGVNTDSMLFCCETTGGYDRALCNWLYGNALDIWRENALQIKRSMGLRKGKSDKADSEMIALYALRCRSQAVLYEPERPELQELRDLFLYRQKLVEEKRAKEVRAKEVKRNSSRSESLDFIYRDAMKAVHSIAKSIKECEQRMLEIVKSDEAISQSYQHLTSFKGIGSITALMLIVYTQNFKFTNPKQTASYFGVAPFYEESGSSVYHRASTSCYSNRRLKGTLRQAALCASRFNPVIKQYKERMHAQGKPTKVILNNIANKMLHIACALIKHDCDFDEDYELKRRLRA